MATAISERLKNQAAETAGMSRVYNRRGRVLSGYGGTLGGYTMSLQKNNADKEDQIMQNKYENGEIGIDEMIAYLTKTSNRAWLSTEDKKLLTQTIGQMRLKKDDADYLDKYNSGTITAKQYLAYKEQRLSKLNVGSALYDSISTDVEQLKKAAGKEDLNDYYKREAARISNLDDATSQYAGYENLYRELSTKANSYGLTNEANDYLAKAGEYKIESNKAAETLKSNNVKQEKASLIDGINLAINSYVNNEMSPQEFSGLLDQFQSKAIGGGHTDLLKDLNSWSNNAREDIQYGKSFDRGGDRIKGPGVGTGGVATYDIYGNYVSGGGSSSGGGDINYTGGGSIPNVGGGSIPNVGGGSDFIGPPAPTTQKQTDTTQHQSPDIEDKTFAESIQTLQNELAGGSLSSADYLSDLASVLADRKDDLDYRLSLLSGKNQNSKVYYQGTNQKISAVITDIQKELNDDWTASLGVDAPDYAKVGINDIYNEISKNPGNLAVVMTEALTTGGFSAVGSNATPLVVRKLPGMSDNYVTDENGINYKINEQTSKEVISSDDYFKLKDEEKANYKVDPTGAGFQKIKDRYIDVSDPKTGQFIRYNLNADNSIKSALYNGTDDVTEATGGKLLSIAGVIKQAESLKKQYDEQVLSEQQTLADKKKSMPNQLGLVGDKNKPFGATKLNLPSEALSPTNTNSIGGNIKLEGNLPLDTSKPVESTIVKPTFANTQAKLDLTPEQNSSAGASINKIMTNYEATKPITNGIITPTAKQNQTNLENKLQIATPTPIANPSGVKINLDQSYAPPTVEKKTSLWDKIKGLFSR
jgi:hypothetical protein